MSEMVEQGARAMWEERRRHARSMGIELEEWGDGSIPKANNIMGEARAMLAAMCEPTSDMIEVATIHFDSGKRMYQAMIDEALK